MILRNHFSFVAVVMLVLAVLGPTVKAELKQEPGVAPYYTTFAEAKAEAAKTNRPIAIDFITDWCVWCKVMDTTLYKEQAGVDFYTKDVVLVKLDAEKADSLLAKSYGVVAYPTVVYTKADGTEYDRIVGYMPTADYLTQARDYLAGKGTLDVLIAEYAATPNRETAAKIAEKYQYRDKKNDARDWLGKVIGDGKTNDSIAGDARLTLVDMLRSEKKYDEALTSLGEVEKLYAGKIQQEWAVLMTGSTNVRKGDTVAAIAAYERFLKMFPASADSAHARKQLGKLVKQNP